MVVTENTYDELVCGEGEGRLVRAARRMYFNWYECLYRARQQKPPSKMRSNYSLLVIMINAGFIYASGYTLC